MPLTIGSPGGVKPPASGGGGGVRPPASGGGGGVAARSGLSRRTWYVLMNSLVLGWMAAALVLVVTVGATDVARGRGADATIPAGIPASGWLLVHLVLLGAATTAILIWSQHFADTLLRRGAPGGRAWQGGRLGAHTVGVLAVVVGMTANWWPLVAVGGGIVVLVAIAHCVSLGVQFGTALPSRFKPLVRYYVLASFALAIGVTLGVLMARPDVGAVVHDRLFVGHVSFNVLGWIGLTVAGTIILLWPTVLRVKVANRVDRSGRWVLVLMTVGLILIALGCAVGMRYGIPVGLAVYLAGLVVLLIDAVNQARQSPPSTYAAWSIGLALVWFLGCVVAITVSAALARSWAATAEAIAPLVLPFVVGFVAQIVVGASSYLLPVVLGGGPLVAKATAAELDRGGLFRIIAINAGLLGLLLPLPGPVRLTLSVLVYATLAAFLVLAVRALLLARRMSRTRDPMEPRTRAAAEDDKPGAGAGAGAETAVLHHRTRSGMIVAAIGALVLAVAVGVALAPGSSGLGGVGVGGAGAGGVEAGGTAAGGIGVNGAAIAPTGRTTTVSMTMKDMRFHPDRIEVPAGNRLVINLSNEDSDVHDLTLADGVTSNRMAPGTKQVVDAGVITKSLDGWCSVTGHRQMGMVFTVVATGLPASGAAGEADASGSGGNGANGSDAGSGMNGMNGMDMGSGHSAHGGAASSGPSAAADVDLMKKPAASFTARDAALAPAASETVHKLTLTVKDTVVEVAPGVRQRLWTYNGTAPGPTLRGHVGDTFDITLVNDGSIGHSIDFHAGELSPDRPMRTIAPGKSLSYTFTATRSGIWLYHCSTMPMSVHIANGMFGAVIIDPPGLAPVAEEYLMVQSEFYLGAQGGTADAAKVAAIAPDLVAFNGYADQYRYRPIAAKPGERVRVWVLDAGPNLSAAFHVVGTQFDTVYREGDYALKDGGSTGTGGSQVLGLAPAQGGFVEFSFPADGSYSFVNHAMTDAERGATGVFKVVG